MLRFSKYKNDHSKKPFFDDLMHLMQTHKGIKFSSENPQTDTFFIAQDKEGSICGGAFLHTGELEHLQLGKILSSPALDTKEVWTCSVCLAPEKTERLTIEWLKMAHSFYRKLYTKLLSFGEERNIGFLCVIMEEKQYLATIKTGLWPYLTALKLPDGFYYAILSLRGSTVDLYRNTLEGYDRLSRGPTLTLEEFEKVERGEMRLTHNVSGV